MDFSYHLQSECRLPETLGQTYLPSFLDAAGFLYIFHGYLDNQP